MSRTIRALNASSSSIKFYLAEIHDRAGFSRVANGEIEGIGNAPHFSARDETGKPLAEQRWSSESQLICSTMLDILLSLIETHLRPDTLAAFRHPIVHDERELTAPICVTPAILNAHAAPTPLTPLHQPHNLAPIRAILALRPDLPHAAYFNPAFNSQPAVATQFEVPRTCGKEGVRRYGFHGLSYEYMAERSREVVPDLADGWVIVVHLGTGASLCAMRSGQSIETKMVFTALDGLMMGTRCGTIVAGVLLYSQRQKGLTIHQLGHVLYNESGRLCTSGLLSDMYDIQASADPRTQEAIDFFVYRINRETPALAGSLGAHEGFVFTAGNGEHIAKIRTAGCERLLWLGIIMDCVANSMMRRASLHRTAGSMFESFRPTKKRRFTLTPLMV